LFLFNQGRLEEALVKIDQAIRQIEGKPRILRPIYRSRTFNNLCACIRARILILTGLGRYGEAREVGAQLQQLEGSRSSPNAALALLELNCGHLDEALAQAQSAPSRDPQYDTMRVITAIAHYTKGEFDRAIQALLYEPGDIKTFYSPADFETVSKDPDGAKLIELQNRKLAGVRQPIRLLLLAKVHLIREDFESANLALDQAEKVLGPEPSIQAAYCQNRARCLAAQGKATEAENYINRLRAIVQPLPKRSLLQESHLAVGISYWYLGRPGDALAELTAAQGFALHPMEKHATAYWMARAHEAAGDPQKAEAYYQIVAADMIPSWMRNKAIEALSRPNHSASPGREGRDEGGR
jgi:tetratricopeptide (TPR) repeat protein